MDDTRTTPPTRWLVHRTLFGPPRDTEPEDLYCVVDRGVAVVDRDRALVRPHARLSTNTYFGRFPAAYWQRWTTARTVSVEITAAGERGGGGSVALLASDSAGERRVVASARIDAGGPHLVAFKADLDRFADGGALWVEANAGAAELTVDHIRWYVASPTRGHGAAVVICTYNRPDECLATLRALATDTECADLLDEVLVIDQGSEAVCEHSAFADAERALQGKLRYLRQANLGGAGGFTRGLVEAGRDRPVHVLLMDDDIVLEPDTVRRLVAFAEHAASPVLVGGQMLQSLHPRHLHVGAEQTRLPRLGAGHPVPDALRHTDMTRQHQELRVDAEYNAWWACLIPPEVVADVGLPLPVFFQWDDIEYGLRAKRRGYPTVTLPGAGVWHSDFSWRDWDDWPRYFSLRNALIVHALHGDRDLRRTAVWLAGELARYLVSMRYGLAETLVIAVEDFLAGPEVLLDGGAAAADRIRKARAEYAETAVHPSCGAFGHPVVKPDPEPSMPRLVLVKRVVWHVLGISRGAASIRAADARWWHVSLFRTAVVTDPTQSGVRVRQRDLRKASRLVARGVRVLGRLVAEGPRVRRRYLAALPELSGEANWLRLFNGTDEARGE
ncbi:glycosyltransferase [Actinokineospora auranticolor]|nr:glycosyltransferase [Actinokineospora auranticolor]